MGGKKKKSTGGAVKKESKYKIPRTFDCPLCDAKGAIRIDINKVACTALISCRACQQPNPPFVAEYGRLSKKHDAFFEFYEWLRQKDRDELEKRGITVQQTAEQFVGHGEALEGFSTHAAGVDSEVENLLAMGEH